MEPSPGDEDQRSRARNFCSASNYAWAVRQLLNEKGPDGKFNDALKLVEYARQCLRVGAEKLPGAPLKVSDSRYPIDYATAAPFAIGFLDPPMLAIEEMNMGISRWPITLRN